MANEHIGSTVPRRQLGRRLRDLREAARLTVTQVVTALEWSKPRLWRYETGQVPIHPNDVDAMCRLYGADAELTDALKSLARETKSKGWWHAYSDIPEWFELFLGMEAAASRIRQYEAEVIPGLVQSASYAEAATVRCITREPTPEILERGTAVRLQRQQILTRRAPTAPNLEIFLSEAALLRGFTAEIMIDQLTCLLALSERPNISIRVVPLTAGPHRAFHGSFVILDFPEETPARGPEPTTVYSEHPTGALYLDKPTEVETYARIWGDLGSVALDQPVVPPDPAEGEGVVAVTQDLDGAVWRKSTRSGGEGNCVEVATNLPDLVVVRDTKNRDGGTLAFSPLEWSAFIDAVRRGEFDL